MLAKPAIFLLVAEIPSAICHYSDQVYVSDEALMRQNSPTHFRLMTSRYVEMVQAARGYSCSHTPSVAFNGHHYFQAALSDDPGIAELITAIASWTGMSLAGAFDFTAFVAISLGILIGYAGFCRLFAERRVRWIGAAIFLCLGFAEAVVADVYIFQISPLIGGIPWILYFALNRKAAALNLSAALLAFWCSWCSLVRIGTTSICIAFLGTLFLGRRRVQKVLLPFLLIALACLPAILFKQYLTVRRDAFLGSVGQPATAVNDHPVWHSIYLGFGFIPNSEVPAYKDEVAMEKVRSIDPSATYASPRYEVILRREIWNIAIHKPILLIENLAAKMGIVLVLAFVVLYPARRVLFIEEEVRWMDAAFVAAIVMSAMSVILVAPKPPYLLTFLCLTFLYSSLMLCRRRFPWKN